MTKSYQVKVYNETGDYLTTWTDIVSEINFSNEINSAGGQMSITLARNAGDYGEGTDVDFNYKIKVYCFDLEQPNGLLIFQGYISSYTPIYKDNKVEVTVLNYGSQFSERLIESAELLSLEAINDEGNFDSQYLFGNGTSGMGSPYTWGDIAQTFTAPASLSVSRLEICAYSSDAPTTGGGSPIDPVEVRLDLFAWNTNMATSVAGSVLATATAYVSDGGWTSFDLSTSVSITSGSVYVWRLTSPNGYMGSDYHPCIIGFSTPSVLANGSAYIWWNGDTGKNGSWSNLSTDDYCFKLYTYEAGTVAVFNSADPSDILKSIIYEYVADGGIINYANLPWYGDTISTTGTEVSYTFNTNTTLEGVNKCLELAPVNWYWYINYGTNYIYFKEKTNTVTHTFSLEKDLIDAKFEKRIEGIVNTVYFNGGIPSGDTDNLFYKFENTESIAKYGRKALKYSDQRVTLAGTAETIANSIIEAKSEPELRVTLEVLDSNNGQGIGYDIESIQVGDVVAVRNVSQQVGLSTWDISRFDEGYWDFNVYNLSSLQMQVQKLDYTPDKLTIYASTMAVDVNKRIEDINRNLETLQAINNPTAPS